MQAAAAAGEWLHCWAFKAVNGPRGGAVRCEGGTGRLLECTL